MAQQQDAEKHVSPLARTDAAVAAADHETEEPASVEAMEAEYRALCDAGLCTWNTNKVQQDTMRADFARLVCEREVDAGTLRRALPVAQQDVPRGKKPAARALVRAIEKIAPLRSATAKRESKDFFDRPVHVAGNTTLH